MRCKYSIVIFIQRISIFSPPERSSYHHCICATNKSREWKAAWLVLQIPVPHLKFPGANLQAEQSWTGALWSTLKNTCVFTWLWLCLYVQQVRAWFYSHYFSQLPKDVNIWPAVVCLDVFTSEQTVLEKSEQLIHLLYRSSCCSNDLCRGFLGRSTECFSYFSFMHSYC